jgi:hypothetical protein
MNHDRHPLFCVTRLAVALVFLSIALAPVVIAGQSGRTAIVFALVGAGPRVVLNGGYIGGVVQECDCSSDKDGIDCPDNGNGTCTRTYHSCYLADGATAKNYCVGSGPASYCGGTSCGTTQYGTCVGTPCL